MGVTKATRPLISDGLPRPLAREQRLGAELRSNLIKRKEKRRSQAVVGAGAESDSKVLDGVIVSES
jgi:hypothetical protein